MGIISGGGGGGGPAAGSYLPAGGPSTLNATTYDDGITGVGKLRTVVTPAEDVVLAAAITGDAHPRLAISSDPGDYGIMLGDGAGDIFGNTAAVISVNSTQLLLTPGSGRAELATGKPLRAATPTNSQHVALIGNVSPALTITSGALPTLTISSGVGRQIAARDAETVTPFTGDATNNAATCKIELSPDDVTYSTLNIMSIAAALNLSGALDLNVNVRVPAAWYIKLTAVHGSLGTTTYY